MFFLTDDNRARDLADLALPRAQTREQVLEIKVEFVRAGGNRDRLISVHHEYLALADNENVIPIRFDIEHPHLLQQLRRIERGLDVTQGADVDSAIDELGLDIGRALHDIGPLQNLQSKDRDVIHIRFVYAAAELALLPLELAIIQAAKSGGSEQEPLSLRGHPRILVTRETRNTDPQPSKRCHRPFILFLACTGGTDYADPAIEQLCNQHEEVLRGALNKLANPFKAADARAMYAPYLKRLNNPSAAEIQEALQAHEVTHIHVVGHMSAQPADQVPAGDVAELRFPLKPNPELSAVNAGPHLFDAKAFADVLAPSMKTKLKAKQPPAVVTLMSCNAGQQSPITRQHGSFVHELHGHGVPLVIGSHIRLSFEASLRIAHRFYTGGIGGMQTQRVLADIWEDLYRERDGALKGRRDWAGLVVYMAADNRALQNRASDDIRRIEENGTLLLDELRNDISFGDEGALADGPLIHYRPSARLKDDFESGVAQVRSSINSAADDAVRRIRSGKLEASEAKDLGKAVSLAASYEKRLAEYVFAHHVGYQPDFIDHGDLATGRPAKAAEFDQAKFRSDPAQFEQETVLASCAALGRARDRYRQAETVQQSANWSTHQTFVLNRILLRLGAKNTNHADGGDQAIQPVQISCSPDDSSGQLRYELKPLGSAELKRDASSLLPITLDDARLFKDAADAVNRSRHVRRQRETSNLQYWWWAVDELGLIYHAYRYPQLSRYLSYSSARHRELMLLSDSERRALLAEPLRSANVGGKDRRETWSWLIVMTELAGIIREDSQQLCEQDDLVPKGCEAQDFRASARRQVFRDLHWLYPMSPADHVDQLDWELALQLYFEMRSFEA